jgi:hypothetical protein
VRAPVFLRPAGRDELARPPAPTGAELAPLAIADGLFTVERRECWGAGPAAEGGIAA